MSIRALLAFIIASITWLSAAESDWKPTPQEPYVMGDPRFQAVDCYRDAAIMMRVYSYIRSRQKTPGDNEDRLLTDFQPIAAHYILKPLDFLLRYPDNTLATELLRFQVTETSGIWPPGKLLALRLFAEHPEVFAAYFRDLPPAQQQKLSHDVRMGFSMANAASGPLIYPIEPERKGALQKRLDELPK